MSNLKSFDKDDLSVQIRYFNSLDKESEERKCLESKVRETTSVLIYSIPASLSFLPESEAAQFYIELYPEIDNIISSYDISRSSYKTYITEICRYKALGYMKKINTIKQTELALRTSSINNEYYVKNKSVLNAGSDYTSLVKTPDVKYQVTELSKRREYEKMGIKEISNHLVNTVGPLLSSHDSNKKEISDFLTIKKNRRAFITLLLSLPGEIYSNMICTLSCILRVDVEALEHFLFLKSELLKIKFPGREKLDFLISKYWKIINSIENTLTSEEDREKRSALKKRLTEATRRHKINRKKREELLKRGLSTPFIAQLLGVSRSTVSNELNYIKGELEKKMALL